MTAPRAILFDLGNVLVSIHPEAFASRLGIDQKAAKGKYQKTVIAMVQRYESGELSTEEYLNELSSLFKGTYTHEELSEAMLKVIGKPVPGMDSLLREVAAKTTVALVSNTNELHFLYCRRQFPILEHFHHFFLSYELKALKPSPLYYKRVLENLGLSPALVVFIDDMEENVEGAQSAGMKGILFTSPGELRESLREFGVIVHPHALQ